jgi:hypothetical protein
MKEENKEIGENQFPLWGPLLQLAPLTLSYLPYLASHTPPTISWLLAVGWLIGLCFISCLVSLWYWCCRSTTPALLYYYYFYYFYLSSFPFLLPTCLLVRFITTSSSNYLQLPPTTPTSNLQSPAALTSLLVPLPLGKLFLIWRTRILRPVGQLRPWRFGHNFQNAKAFLIFRIASLHSFRRNCFVCGSSRP